LPTATATPTGNNNDNGDDEDDDDDDNDNGDDDNDNGDDDDDTGNDNFSITRSYDNTGSRFSSIPPLNTPGVLSSAPGFIPSSSNPGVLSAAPRPGVAAAGPIPPVAAARPPQTPSVLPVAGQLGADLPRLAAIAGIGLVAGGLGLRLRERLFGARTVRPQTVEDLQPEVSDTYLDDKM